MKLFFILIALLLGNSLAAMDRAEAPEDERRVRSLMKETRDCLHLLQSRTYDSRSSGLPFEKNLHQLMTQLAAYKEFKKISDERTSRAMDIVIKNYEDMAAELRVEHALYAKRSVFLTQLAILQTNILTNEKELGRAKLQIDGLVTNSAKEIENLLKLPSDK